MAEVRTHDPEGGSDLEHLVREALGETIRLITLGSVPGVVSPEDESVAGEEDSLTALPRWAGLFTNVTDIWHNAGVYVNNPVVWDCGRNCLISQELKGRNITLNWTELDTRAVDTVRILATDAVEKVGNGHPGTPISLVPVAYPLY